MMTERLPLDRDTDPEKMWPDVRCWSALRSVPTPAPDMDTCYCHEMKGDVMNRGILRFWSIFTKFFMNILNRFKKVTSLATCAGGGAALLGWPGALVHVKLPVVEGVGVGGPAPDTADTRVSRGTRGTLTMGHSMGEMSRTRSS